MNFFHSVFQSALQKMAIALTLSIASYSGLACQVSTSTPAVAATSTAISSLTIPPQSAIIESAMMPLPVFATSSVATSTIAMSTATSTTPSVPTPTGTANVIPNLLPLVTLPPFSMATTTTTTTVITKAPKVVPKTVSTKPSVSTASTVSVSTASLTTNASPATPVAVAATPLTAQSFLDQTTVSLTPNLDSTEQLTFVTNAGAAGKITWNLLTTSTFGFAISTSCTPPPTPALPGAPDQNPSFAVRTAYDCTVSLAPQSGTDRRIVSQDFNFTTNPGRLVASLAAETDSLLQNNTNDGGFTFNNQDSQPVTITGLTVDVSYTGVVTSTNLLVLRFADPETGASLYDYPLASDAPGGSTNDVSIPLSFTIPAKTARVLPVNAIGVSILAVDGTNPTINVTLEGMTVNDGIPTKLISSQISWSCVVPTTGYDPYATSSAFLSGQACGTSQN